MRRAAYSEVRVTARRHPSPFFMLKFRAASPAGGEGAAMTADARSCSFRYHMLSVARASSDIRFDPCGSHTTLTLTCPTPATLPPHFRR